MAESGTPCPPCRFGVKSKDKFTDRRLSLVLAHSSIVMVIAQDTSTLTGRYQEGGSAMAKLHARPSNQYRYEHYDPR
jgi:hypothetical protein